MASSYNKRNGMKQGKFDDSSRYAFGPRNMRHEGFVNTPPKDDDVDATYKDMMANSSSPEEKFYMAGRFQHCAYSCVQANPGEGKKCSFACVLELLEFVTDKDE